MNTSKRPLRLKQPAIHTQPAGLIANYRGSILKDYLVMQNTGIESLRLGFSVDFLRKHV